MAAKKNVEVWRPTGTYFRPGPPESAGFVEALDEFSVNGIEFIIHKALGKAKRFSVTEVRTGYKIGDSDCIAGNGNTIPADLKGFKDYCREQIPFDMDRWLRAAIEDALLKRQSAQAGVKEVQ